MMIACVDTTATLDLLHELDGTGDDSYYDSSDSTDATRAVPYLVLASSWVEPSVFAWLDDWHPFGYMNTGNYPYIIMAHQEAARMQGKRIQRDLYSKERVKRLRRLHRQ